MLLRQGVGEGGMVEMMVGDEDMAGKLNISIAKLEDDVTTKLMTIETNAIIEAASKAAEAVVEEIKI